MKLSTIARMTEPMNYEQMRSHSTKVLFYILHNDRKRWWNGGGILVVEWLWYSGPILASNSLKISVKTG